VHRNWRFISCSAGNSHSSGSKKTWVVCDRSTSRGYGCNVFVRSVFLQWSRCAHSESGSPPDFTILCPVQRVGSESRLIGNFDGDIPAAAPCSCNERVLNCVKADLRLIVEFPCQFVTFPRSVKSLARFTSKFKPRNSHSFGTCTGDVAHESPQTMAQTSKNVKNLESTIHSATRRDLTSTKSYLYENRHLHFS
jgi:hypothetical protein